MQLPLNFDEFVQILLALAGRDLAQFTSLTRPQLEFIREQPEIDLIEDFGLDEIQVEGLKAELLDLFGVELINSEATTLKGLYKNMVTSH